VEGIVRETDPVLLPPGASAGTVRPPGRRISPASREEFVER
jgi:hypothetical protein